ncbi:hypothetical protein INR49_006676, partial [Caranx melampygus]
EDTDPQIHESLSIENTLWASTVVASGTVIGVVIYTGKETRSVLNTSYAKNKVNTSSSSSSSSSVSTGKSPTRRCGSSDFKPQGFLILLFPLFCGYSTFHQHLFTFFFFKYKVYLL